MCGRYYVDDETAREIEKIVEEIEGKVRRTSLTGDIYPTQEAPVLVRKNQKVSLRWQRWGFPRWNKKGVIFNSRSETVLEKTMFRESILHRRAVIPCAGFYEWNRSKEKVSFRRQDSPVIFMGGFFNLWEGEERFVIMTTEANPFVAPVHSRMPLVLERDEIGDWLLDDETFQTRIGQRPVVLKKHQLYEQETFKFI